MPASASESLVRRFFDEVVNRHDLTILDQLLAAGFEHSGLLPGVAGAAEFREACGDMLAAFPDLHLELQQVISAGDTVATRGRWTGTHRGEIMGIPATGRTVDVAYIDFWTVRDGLLAANWVQMDFVGLRQQLTEGDLHAIARSIYDAWNARDFDFAVGKTSPDIEWVVVPLGTGTRGQAGYRRAGESWALAFEDAQVEVTDIIAGDNQVVVEFTGRGTHSGPLPGPGGATIPPTGRRVEAHFVDVLEFEDGKIKRGREYFDLASMMAQLGVGAPAAEVVTARVTP